MGLFSFIKDAVGVTKAHGNNQQMQAIFDLFRHDQPAKLTKKQQIAMFYTSPAFYGALLRVADACASVDRVVKIDGEPVDDHPLLHLMDNPNSHMSGHVYRILQQLYREIAGESFALPMEIEAGIRQAERGMDETDMRLVPIPPTRVDLEHGKWRVRFSDKDEVFEMDELFWQKGLPDLRQPLGRGMGFGNVLQDELQADEFASRFETSFFMNGAKPEFVISLLGAGDDRAEAFERRWKQRFQGPDKGFQPVIFNSEDPAAQLPEITELTQRFKDISVSKFREFEHEVIRRTIGVPPEILGIVTNSNRATIESAELIMQKFVVKPRVKQWEDDWNRHIVPLFDPSGRTKVCAEVKLPEDKEHKRAIMKNHKEAFTVNEIRASAGEPPRKDGDVYMRPIDGGGGLVAVPADEVETEATTRSAQGEEQPVIKLNSKPPREIRSKKDNPDFVFKSPEDPDLVAREADIEPLEETSKQLEEEMMTWVEHEAQDLGLEEVPAEVESDVREYIRDYSAERITQINDKTRDEIRDIVDQGLREGWGVQQVEQELQSKYEQFDETRSRTIAQTEMGRAANQVKNSVHKRSNKVRGEQWVTNLDGRQRDAHDRLHRQVTDPDQPFVVPSGDWAGATAQFPGDFGIAALDVMCRCTVVGVKDKSKPPIPIGDKADSQEALDLHEKLWKSFDRRLKASEDALEDSFKVAFNKQWNDYVQPALQRVLGTEAA